MTTVSSPVLVGRDEELAAISEHLAAAAAGAGRLLLVAGEAGIGKTRLLAALARRAERDRVQVLHAAAFPGDVAASGGLLLDLASDLRTVPEDRLRAAGRDLAARLRAPSPDSAGDDHRHRRVLVQDLSDALLDLDVGGPALLVLEDLHWADPLSLEVVEHAVRRLGRHRLLVAAAYRSDELHPHLPLRDWRRRLLVQRLAEEVPLHRLTVAQTATIASTLLAARAPTALVSAVHERSDGIPLHVEELLAAMSGSGGEAVDLDRVPVPETLADAVLARAAALEPALRQVADAAAVLGRSVDLDLLAAVLEHDPAEVAEATRRLRAAQLLGPGSDGARVDFRHALIRDALYDDVPERARRALHARVAVAAALRGYPPAVVSDHFERAGLSAQAHETARAAAAQAAALSSHREALELYQRVLRCRPPDLPPDQHARLLTQLGDEAVAVDDNATAQQAYRQAAARWTAAGDAQAAAALAPALCNVGHLLGEPLAVRAARLHAALDDVGTGPGTQRLRAQLLAALATAHLVDDRLDEAHAYGTQSRALSELVGLDRTDVDLTATLGSATVLSGQTADGWALLEDAVASAVERRHEAEAARAYRMLGSTASVLVEYDRAERALLPGIAYAEAVELANHQHYMASHLAHVQWATGQLEAAERTAQQALADGRGGTTTRNTALYVLGFVALARGDTDAADGHLSEALHLGRSMGELQRIAPPLWGLAETALLVDDPGRAAELGAEARAMSAQVRDAAYLFPFLVTGARAHVAAGDLDAAVRWWEEVAEVVLARSIPGTLPAVDHARGVVALASGDTAAARRPLERAVDAWASRRRWWEGTWALLDAARCAGRSRRRSAAAGLVARAREAAVGSGATALVAEADRAWREAAGSRPPDPWAPLSAREFEVAELIAAGLTNREIAARLVLSPKTVAAHVEHILVKLGASRRAEVAAWAAGVRR